MFGWKTFNDRLALLVLVIIPVLWLIEGWGKIKLAGEVNGALIMAWALVLQYYFRRAPSNSTPGTGG